MKKIILAVMILAFSAIGCATIDTLQPGTGEKFTIQGKSYDEIWNAAIKTAKISLTIVSSNKGHGSIRAEKGAGLATWGEVVGIFITPATNGASTYIVEVQSQKRLKGQITGQDWTETMTAGIKAELGM